MKYLSILALTTSLAAQTLPAPSFPPITFNHVAYGGNCVGAQVGAGSTDAQKTTFYLNQGPTFDVGRWVTHETWCESLPGGNYSAILFIDAGIGQCTNVWLNPPTILGAPFVNGFNKAFLANTPITATPTHAIYSPFNTFYYVGYQIPSTLLGYSVVSQWARFDPNGGLYLSNVNGYVVSQ